MEIKNLFLDMDETILDFNMAERFALEQALLSMGVEPEEELIHAYHEINISQWKLLEKGLLTREVLKVRRFELLIDKMKLSLDPVQIAKVYEGLLKEGFFFKDGAKEVLEELYGSYSLYLFSNGSSKIQHNRIQGTGIEKFFDGIYISEDVGADKPSATYFERCFKDIEMQSGMPLDLSSCLMIGDSLTSDIAGGKNVGVKTIWINEHEKRPEGIVPDYEIASVRELPIILENIKKQ